MNVLQSLKNNFDTFIFDTFKTRPDTNQASLEINTDPQKAQFGDFNSNIAMILAKKLQQNPRIIAQKVVDNFNNPWIEKIEIAGPGFLNFYLKIDFFKSLAAELFEQKDLFFKSKKQDQNYNIEFISANPTGPLHLGHGRGGIIGDVLANVLTFLGYNVTKEHYINDAGSQMQKLGNSLLIRCKQILGESIEFPEDGYQGEYIKDLADKCIKEHGQDVVKNELSFFIEYAYQHLLKKLQTTVKNYGINFDVWFSEKILHPEKVETALKKLEANGYTYKKDGAVWFKSTEFNDDKDRVLQKADGQFTYAAADAAYLIDKASRGFTTIIIVLGQDHHSYPKRLEGIRQALGLHDIGLRCILYQLVSLKESGQNVKLSKRAGKIISLDDVTQTVGSDIARFFYLNRKAEAHLDFDLDTALSSTDENPVYYLQYAYVRTKSILQKSSNHSELANINKNDNVGIDQEEILLIKKLTDLKPLLENIGNHYHVHLLTYYLLDLAHTFHNYYHHNRVLEPKNIEQSRARLLITTLVQEQFNRCLQLIGVSQPDTM